MKYIYCKACNILFKHAAQLCSASVGLFVGAKQLLIDLKTKQNYVSEIQHAKNAIPQWG